jgi:hypothetical protein
MRSSKSSASRMNGPQAAGEPAGRAGHRHAAGVARERLRELVETLRQPLHELRVGALLGSEHLGATLPRDLHVAQHDDPRTAQPAGIVDGLQCPRAAIGGGRAADRDEDHLRAALDRVGDQLAGAVGAGRPRVALRFIDE